MKRLGRALLRITKGIYDILGSYLLAVVLYVALVSMGLHAVFSLLAEALEYDDAQMMWRALSHATGIGHLWIRLVVYVGLQGGLFWLLSGTLTGAMAVGERIVDGLISMHGWLAERIPGFRGAFGAVFSLALTALLIPFVVQPTLVPLRLTPYTVLERAVNLADGTATFGAADSVVGFYRRLYAEPSVDRDRGVDTNQFDNAWNDHQNPSDPRDTIRPPKPTGQQPIMDRWDPIIWEAANQDPKRFAQIKAFMWVESAGRQFAVSHTGCLGLMQFCSRTAKSGEFGKIFGTGQVYRCVCEGPCRVPKPVQRDLERGLPSKVDEHRHAFPCEITDARFDARKAIFAGAEYIDQLDRAYGGNIYLMYIGYNSGPGVANKVYAALGRDSGATLDDISRVLGPSMYKWYHERAERRARGLARVHLPKIEKAFDRYYDSGAAQPSAVAMR